MNWPIPYINISWECIIRPRHMRGMQRCCLVLPDITWSVCVSTSNKHEPCRNGSTDWDAVWSCGPRNSVLGGGLNPPGKGQLIFGVPLQCSLSSEFFGHLLSLNSCTFQHSVLPVLNVTEEFSQMKEEVPPPLVDAHLRTVQEAVKEGLPVDPSYALDKTGIAGTAVDRTDRETGFYHVAYVHFLLFSFCGHWNVLLWWCISDWFFLLLFLKLYKMCEFDTSCLPECCSS